MTSPDIRTLEVFIAVCETGSMTEAGRRLGLTQSAVSQQIGQMEQDFGTPMFDRRLRPIALTAGGRVVRATARSVLADLGEIRVTLSERGITLLPEIRVGIADGLEHRLASALHQDLRPFVDQVCILTNIGDAHAALQQRSIDVLINVGETELSDMDVQETAPQKLLLVCGGVKIACSELRERQREFISYAPRTPMGRAIHRHLRRLGIAPQQKTEVDNIATLIDLIRITSGWAVLPEACLPVSTHNVHILPFPGKALALPVSVVSCRREYKQIHKRISATVQRVLGRQGLATACNQEEKLKVPLGLIANTRLSDHSVEV